MLGVPKNIGILVTLCHVHKMFLPIVVVKPMRIGVSLNFIIVVVVARCVVFVVEEGTSVDKVVLVGDVEGISYDDKEKNIKSKVKSLEDALKSLEVHKEYVSDRFIRTYFTH